MKLIRCFILLASTLLLLSQLRLCHTLQVPNQTKLLSEIEGTRGNAPRPTYISTASRHVSDRAQIRSPLQGDRHMQSHDEPAPEFVPPSPYNVPSSTYFMKQLQQNISEDYTVRKGNPGVKNRHRRTSYSASCFTPLPTQCASTTVVLLSACYCNNGADLTSDLLKALLAEQSSSLLQENMFSTHQEGQGSLHDIVYLNLAFNIISQVEKGMFANLTLLQTLSLDNNKITYIEMGTWFALNSLTDLTLAVNCITYINRDTFPVSLRRLDLSYNKLTQIYHNMFTNLTALWSLSLQSNTVSTIESGSWYSLTSLRQLMLNKNNIKFITRAMFATLSNTTTHLYLPNNEITLIEDFSFSSCSNLALFAFNFNKLSVIKNNTFSGLSRLIDLRLSFNHITNLEVDAFAHFRSITDLNLPFNQLTSVTFSYASAIALSQLKTLNLHSNRITVINNINLLNDLDSLDLAKNLLTSLGADLNFALTISTLTRLSRLLLYDNLLTSLPKLRGGLLEVDLSGNSIQLLSLNETVSFSELTRLERLRISSNIIFLRGDLDFFRCPRTIMELSLSNTEIRVLNESSFTGYSSLVVLDLSQNHLSFIENYIFAHQTSLKYLDVSKNRLSSIEDFAFTELINLQELDLHDNLITQIAPIIFVKCTALQKLFLNMNQISVLAAGIFSSLSHLKTLSLSSNRLTSISSGVFGGFADLEFLYLSHNRITLIEDQAWPHLTNLRALYLNSNILSVIDNSWMSPISQSNQLQIVLLGYNNITTIEFNMHQQWTSNFKILIMEGNPSVCESRATLIPEVFADLNHNWNIDASPTQNVTVTCICAEGYVGLDFCIHTSSLFKVQPLMLSGYSKSTCSSVNGDVASIEVKGNDVLRDIMVSTEFLISGSPSSQKYLDVLNSLSTQFLISGSSSSQKYLDVLNSLKGNSILMVTPSVCSIGIRIPWAVSVFNLDVLSDEYLACAWVLNNPYQVNPSVNPCFKIFPRYLRSPRTIIIESSFGELVVTSINVQLNPNIPSEIDIVFPNITCHVHSSRCSNVELGENSARFRQVVSSYSSTGDVLIDLSWNLNSAKFVIAVYAREKMSEESLYIANIAIDITDCPVITMLTKLCSLHGYCVDNDNPYDGIFTCQCLSNYTNADCSSQLIIQTVVSPSSSGIDLTYLYGYIVAPSVAGLTIFMVSLCVILKYRRRDFFRKDHHIFISYRFSTDADLARELCNRLQNECIESDLKIKCYFDQQDIYDGTRWEESFLTGLQHCCLFVPLISEAAIGPIKMVSPTDKTKDFMLLEYEHAAVLQKENRLAILPILIGKRIQTTALLPFKAQLPSPSALSAFKKPSFLNFFLKADKPITLPNHLPENDSTAVPAINVVENNSSAPIPDVTFEKFNWSEYGGHVFPANRSKTSDVPVRDTMTAMFGFQSLLLEKFNATSMSVFPGKEVTLAPKQTNLIHRIVETLRFTAWHDKKVLGRKHWKTFPPSLPKNSDGTAAVTTTITEV